MNAKLFLKSDVHLITAVTPAKITLKKLYLLFRKMSIQRAFLCKIIILTSNQLSPDHYSNVVVLLCTAKTKRMQSLMETVTHTDLMSYWNLERGQSATSAVSNLKFFLTTVNSWESLDVVILYPPVILYSPLLEAETRELNKHQTSRRKFY